MSSYEWIFPLLDDIVPRSTTIGCGRGPTARPESQPGPVHALDDLRAFDRPVARGHGGRHSREFPDPDPRSRIGRGGKVLGQLIREERREDGAGESSKQSAGRPLLSLSAAWTAFLERGQGDGRIGGFSDAARMTSGAHYPQEFRMKRFRRLFAGGLISRTDCRPKQGSCAWIRRRQGHRA